MKKRGTGAGAGERVARDESSRFLVLLENIEQQNRSTAEAVLGLRRDLLEKLDGLERRLTLRIEVLELAIRHLADEVRKNSADSHIQELKRRVSELALAVDGKPSADELKKIEQRVSRLEAQLGITPASS